LVFQKIINKAFIVFQNVSISSIYFFGFKDEHNTQNKNMYDLLLMYRVGAPPSVF